MEQKTYRNEWEYFNEIIYNRAEDYVKPVVHYTRELSPVEVGKRASVITVDHPASYLNDAPWVNTSLVVSVEKDGSGFDTLNTKYRKVI